MVDIGLRATRRAVISIRGEDAVTFLDGLVSGTVEGLATGSASSAALLTPQGKILFDMLVVRVADGLLVDVGAEQVADLAKRLTFYKLRAKVTIAIEPDLAVQVLASAAPIPQAVAQYPDPRDAGLGWRAIVPAATVATPDDGAYDRRRIALGIAEGGIDYRSGEVFPADVNMDLVHGVDFTKGCFVGQEVAARMHHKTVARRRLVLVSGTDPLPAAGTEITVEGKPAGVLGGALGTSGLAIVRLDRIGEALASGLPILAGEVALTPALPAYGGFDWQTASPEP